MTEACQKLTEGCHKYAISMTVVRVRLAWARAAMGAGVLAAALVAACSPSPGAPAHPTADEAALRARLGIPPEAKQVILFAQTSHFDVDWQKTFDGYYSAFVEGALTQAGQLLATQPRAFYSVAEMSFLKHHLEVHPEQLPLFQAAAARGALRVVGGGVTSPDTLLPEPELLFGDYRLGGLFAEGWLGVRPTAAWLPDSFGHSGTAPDILAAAGFTSVAFARIDGAPTLFEEILYPERGDKPGSSAALLQSLGSADFRWRGAGGATVLAHFMAGDGLYCQGDNLDYDESLEQAGGHTGPYRGDDPAFTDARIDLYASQLAPYAKTPYLFVPVGCDFQAPKANLLAYLDGYDQRRYPTTGIYAAVAPFDLYAALVAGYSDRLPELDGDLSPYYMGFYGSRAEVKRGTRDAARPFLTAAPFAALLGDEGREDWLAAEPALELLERSDHHDFVTGTANDAVTAGEQLPLLADAQDAGEALLGQLGAALAEQIPSGQGAAARVLALNASSEETSGVAELPLSELQAAADSSASAHGANGVGDGGAGGSALLDGAGNLAVHPVFADAELPAELSRADGGTTLRFALQRSPPFSYASLELRAGAPAPLGGTAARAPAEAVTLSLLDAQGAPATASSAVQAVLDNGRVRAVLENPGDGFALTSVRLDGAEALAGPSLLVHDASDQGGLWRLGNEMPGCALTPMADPPGAAALAVLESTPLVARVAFTSPATSAAPGDTRELSLAAGDTGLTLAITTGAAAAVTRTVSFALASRGPLVTSSPAGFLTRPVERVYDPTFWPAVAWVSSGPWAILLRQSTGAAIDGSGTLSLMAARNAQTEQCDVEGGTGSDPGLHRIEWKLAAIAGPADAERQAQSFDRPLRLLAATTNNRGVAALPQSLSLAQVSGDGLISETAPAERAGGLVIRALLEGGSLDLFLDARFQQRSYQPVDLLERPLGGAGTTRGQLELDPGSGSIVSLWIR